MSRKDDPLCAVCGDHTGIISSAKPSYLTQRHGEVREGQVFWFYCFNCHDVLNEIAARRKKNRMSVLVLPGPPIDIEIGLQE